MSLSNISADKLITQTHIYWGTVRYNTYFGLLATMLPRSISCYNHYLHRISSVSLKWHKECANLRVYLGKRAEQREMKAADTLEVNKKYFKSAGGLTSDSGPLVAFYSTLHFWVGLTLSHFALLEWNLTECTVSLYYMYWFYRKTNK